MRCSSSERTIHLPTGKDALQLTEHGLFAPGDGAHTEEAAGRLGHLPGAAQQVFAKRQLSFDAEPRAQRGDEVAPGLEDLRVWPLFEPRAQQRVIFACIPSS
jgi:hypothetical protein